MNFKKIYTYFICYLTLVAFIGIISFEISSRSVSSHTKTQITASKNNLNNGIEFIFEEEKDADEPIDLTRFCVLIFNYTSTAASRQIDSINDHYFISRKIIFLNCSLFISLKNLRI